MPTHQQIASAQAIRSKLVTHGQESATEYGRALFAEHGQRVADALDALLTRFVLNPAIAGPHYEALPLLLHFSSRGVKPMVTVTLGILSNSRRFHSHAGASASCLLMQARVMNNELQELNYAYQAEILRFGSPNR